MTARWQPARKALTDNGAKKNAPNTGGIAIVRDNERLREHEDRKTEKQSL